MMTVKALLRTSLVVAMLVFAPVHQAFAAGLNLYFHLYTIDGMAIGEIRFDDQVAFRLRVATDGARPVISLQKSGGGQEISPDITNGMFMLRLTGSED